MILSSDLLLNLYVKSETKIEAKTEGKIKAKILKSCVARKQQKNIFRSDLRSCVNSKSLWSLSRQI